MIPAFIMAVPWDPQRAVRANQIRKESGGTVVWDQTQNAMDTFRLVLDQVQGAGDEAFLLLQDDVKLTTDWRQKVENVIADHGSRVIQFFSMNKADRILGSRLVDGESFISNLCVYFPAGYAQSLLSYSYDFVEKYPKFKTADDFVVRYFLRNRREQFWLQTPSLVQHEAWISAINAKRPRNRRSHNFEGEVR